MVGRSVVVGLLLLAGCPEHGSTPGLPDADVSGPDVPRPDAKTDPLCGFVDCGQNRHCEARCQPAGTNGCVDQCHVTCVPDTPCSAIDCGAGKKCVESCSDDCSGFAWLCQQTCEPETSPSCEAVADEVTCRGRAECVPVFVGAGCTCMGNLCSCADPDATFSFCRTL